MMEPTEAWAVFGPDGNMLAWTCDITQIRSHERARKGFDDCEWVELATLGYKCRRVLITEVEG